MTTAPGQVEFDVHPHDREVRLCERVTDPPRADGAAAQGEHGGVGARERLQDGPLFAGAKSRLAVLGEDTLDRLAKCLLELCVDIDRRGPERGRGARGRSRLARPHEADQG